MDKTIDYYNKKSNSYIEDTITADVSGLYTLFQRFVKPGANILDLGCGSGRDSKYFLSSGYTVTSIDGSEELCKKAQEYIGQKVYYMMFNQIQYDEQFDGIWACSSLLHVPIEELPNIFERIRKALKPDGYLYASFKYGDFSGERNGRHFTDLNEITLSNLLREVGGFRIVESIISDDVRPGRSEEKWLNVILNKL